jgi:hypothetical protein
MLISHKLSYIILIFHFSWLWFHHRIFMLCFAYSYGQLSIIGEWINCGSFSPPPLTLIMLSCKELAFHACEPSLLFYDSSMLEWDITSHKCVLTELTNWCYIGLILIFGQKRAQQRNTNIKTIFTSVPKYWASLFINMFTLNPFCTMFWLLLF